MVLRIDRHHPLLQDDLPVVCPFLHGLLKDHVFLCWVCPDQHPQHPLQVRRGIGSEPAVFLPLLLQNLDEPVEGLDGMEVASRAFRDGVGYFPLKFKVHRILLHYLPEVISCHHRSKVGQVIDLLQDVVELPSVWGLLRHFQQSNLVKIHLQLYF